MSGTAVATVDPTTGEVFTPATFDFNQYVGTLDRTGLQRQQQLAAAYDAACASLVGPNDVQQDGGRSFKKKSAWRKLARHFTVSCYVEDKPALMEVAGQWVVTVRARAVAPWGQVSEDVGSCGSDEQTGRRTITLADAIATASTRAHNRAISNLIAMGEVSAEEIGERKAYPTTTPTATRTTTATPRTGDGPVMPFGKMKGTPLGALPTSEIESALQWAVSKDKFREFQAEARAELALRNGAPKDLEEPPFPTDDPDDLPFG
jgi:hypothetical protein